MEYHELQTHVQRAADNYRLVRCVTEQMTLIVEVHTPNEVSINEIVDGMDALDDFIRLHAMGCDALILNTDCVMATVDTKSGVPEEVSQALVTMGITAKGAYVLRVQTYWDTKLGVAFEVMKHPPEAPFLPVLAQLQAAWGDLE